MKPIKYIKLIQNSNGYCLFSRCKVRLNAFGHEVTPDLTNLLSQDIADEIGSHGIQNYKDIIMSQLNILLGGTSNGEIGKNRV